jgi:transposase InsO family protein
VAGAALDCLAQWTESLLATPGCERTLVSFNSQIRDECLNINSFWSLAQARVVISDWKHDYNHHRRHSALGYQPPARYAATCAHR